MKKIVVLFILGLLLFNAQVILGESKYKSEWQQVAQKREKDLQKNPQDYITKYELAVAYSNLGEIEKAAQLFKELKKVDNREQRLEELIKNYQADCEDSNPDIKRINYLAFAHYTADDYKKSKQLFEEIVSLDSENIWSYNYLAVTQHELKKYNKAKQTLENSLEIKDDEYTQFLLGANYYKQGNLFKAFYHVRKGRKAANLFLDD
ncbi:MAG: hypothetical protein R6V17_09330 [Halanaerobacter sp.]